MAKQVLNDGESGLIIRGKINDNFTELYQVSGFAKVERNASQSIPEAGPTAISWDTEHFDNAAIYAGGAPTRLTVPAGVGNFLVLLTAQIFFASSDVGFRRAFVYKNGAIIGTAINIGSSCPALDAGSGTFLTVVVQDVAAGGDYYEVRLDQSSGGNLNIQALGQISISGL